MPLAFRSALPAAALALLVAGSAAAAPRSPGQRQADELQRFMAGATAGAPVDCLPSDRNMSSTIVDERTIVFRPNASTRYVAKLDPACPGLRWDRAIVTRTPSSRLCRGDIFTVVDPPTPGVFGSCAFGEFTPYRRNK